MSEVVQAVCQLAGLRELVVWGSPSIQEEGLLFKLTQLSQLTRLHFNVGVAARWHSVARNGLADQIKLSGEMHSLKCILWLA